MICSAEFLAAFVLVNKAKVQTKLNNKIFTPAETEAVYKAIYNRRDMRHFKPKSTIETGCLNRILSAAHAAPSVGFMQPWRFIRITSTETRNKLQNIVEQERQKTADALDQRKTEFLKYKIEGIQDCAEVIVVCLTENRDEYIFGRRTLPQMDLASASCAIQNMWLAARAENLGMGWVSIFEPKDLAELLNLPATAEAIAILCLGPVEAFYEQALLEQEGWDKRKDLSELISENTW